MPAVSVAESFAAPKQQIWDLLADYGNVHRLHANIVGTRILKSVAGVGGVRACEFRGGQGVDEEITAWTEGEVLAFTATAFRKLPMQRMVGTFRFEGDQPTRLTVTLEYRMKGGFLMDLMARGMMRKAAQGFLDGVRAKV